nr:hypothetical protein [uncultured Desulfobacter sp.]
MIICAAEVYPELASSIISVKNGAHDIAIGNVLGPNLFNMFPVQKQHLTY